MCESFPSWFLVEQINERNFLATNQHGKLKPPKFALYRVYYTFD